MGRIAIENPVDVSRCDQVWVGDSLPSVRLKGHASGLC